MAEVDKFKRRVIRAVARLLRKDQAPGEEMWKALQNEAGCDCKLLWQRMRALTLKKMKRLILAEDRLENIAAVAKMTLTDWLLFDLVLVHEDIDVIGQDLKTEPAILAELFSVVKRFQIEGKQGEALATAWTAATFFYNSFGRQCSPMLLQRRWYQLKKLTRAKFYKFWFEYRGNARLLNGAKEHQPTKLQSDIAQRYPHIVTMPFLEWDKMIKERWVILPEEFESKLKKKSANPKPIKPASTASEPDIVLLEPRIETIDLGVDSDHEAEADENSKGSAKLDENSKDSNPDDSSIDSNQPLNPVSLAAAIKNEPQDEFEMDFEDEFAARTLQAEETLDNDDSTAAAESLDNDDVTDDAQETIKMPMICAVAGNFDESSVAAALVESSKNSNVMDEVNNILISAVERRKGMSNDIVETDTATDPSAHKLDGDEPMPIEAETQPIEIDESDDSFTVASGGNEVMTEINNILKSAVGVNEGSVDIIKPKVRIGPKSRVPRPDVETAATSVESTSHLVDVDECDKNYSRDGEVMSEINTILESAIKENTKHKALVKNMDTDKNTADKAKQRDLAKDDADTHTIKVTDTKVDETPVENLLKNIKSGIEASSFDTAIDPVIEIPTDLTFEDDGIELVDDGIAFEEETDYAEEKTAEVKTESGLSTSPVTDSTEDSPKFDLKLLMHPCVYTIRLDDMTVFKNESIKKVKDKIKLETAFLESKIQIKQEKIEIKEERDNESIKSGNKSDEYSSDSDDGIPESKRVKLTSYMLQKPKSRSYNPIQLCKNPDFNTRLKRLTFGFLSSNRNRMLLKCLKPMTIDLSKAFENKLINGTVYLKTDDEPKIKQEKPDEVTEEPNVTAVMPSAMPVQSLIDNSNINLQDLLPSPPRPVALKPQDLPERQRTINLPDINNIRRINQNLLTAEVTPMRMQANDKFTPPVQLVSLPKTQENNPKTVVAARATNENNQAPTTEAAQSLSTGLSISSGAPPEKKKYARPNLRLSWNKVKPTKCTAEDEFLLTLDALNKMLNLFNEEKPEAVTQHYRKQKRTLVKQKLELQKRMEQFEKKVEDGPSETEKEVEDDDKDDRTEESKKENKEEEPPPPPPPFVKPKINILKDKPYAPYCCWARNKLSVADGKKAIRAHQCPRICQCCCRAELAQKINRPKYKFVGRASKQSTIVISDEDEEKKAVETIENVVEKTQTVNYVPAAAPVVTKPIKKKIDMSTQCAMGSLVGKKQVWLEPRDEQKPVRVRKDLLPALSPLVRTYPKAHHQGHITIDGSRDKVKIHSQPVYIINSDGQNKIVYLNNIKNQKITSPIFLGENKILLTDVKFPGTSPSESIPKASVPSVTPLSGVPAIPVALPSVPVAVPTVPTVPVAEPTVPTVPEAVPAVAVPASTAPTVPLALPGGVQVILLPDGQLTYTVEPGSKPTDEELATLPVILEAISQQLNATNTAATSVSIPPASGEVDLTQEDDPTAAAKSDACNEISAPENIESVAVGGEAMTEQDKQETNTSRHAGNETEHEPIENNKEDQTVTDSDVSEATSSSNDKKIGDLIQNETENASLVDVNDKILLDNTTVTGGECTAGSNNAPVSISENTNDSTNSTDQSNRKTLLSDLMEMSGISEEDIQSNISAVPAAIPTVNLDEPPALIPNLNVTRVSTGPAMPSIPELTPVKSFSELKYACERNGNFFKLDLQLGTLSKIAVCIKKNKPKLPPLVDTPRDVVDLTDDKDEDNQAGKDIPLDEMAIPAHKIKTNKNVITLNEEVLPKSVIKTNRSLLRSSNPPTEGVKPLKLFRAIRILKRKSEDSTTPVNVTNLGKGLPESVTVHVKHQRKQQLLTKTALGDEHSISQSQGNDESNMTEVSNVEEIEDSSIDSSELNQYIWKDTDDEDSDIETLTDSDTSDDEPLAHKAKRMRVNEQQPQQEGSGQEIEEEVVARPEEVIIRTDDAIEMKSIHIQGSGSEKEVVKDTAKGANIAKAVEVTTGVTDDMEEADIAEANIEGETILEEAGVAETELTGEDDVPLDDEMHLLPALEMVRMEEDGDDEDCILGF